MLRQTREGSEKHGFVIIVSESESEIDKRIKSSKRFDQMTHESGTEFNTT